VPTLENGQARRLIHVRDPARDVKPGEEFEASVTWRRDDTITPGTRVEATDGPLGVMRERVIGEGPEHAYLGVETSEGLYYVPERLVRESTASVVYLSLPVADARAQSSRDHLPVVPTPGDFPQEPHSA
jgi:hypothetical protein